MRATGPTRLLVLPQAGLAALRQGGSAGSDAYDALLDSALAVSARRIEATLARLSAAAGQVPVPEDPAIGSARVTRAHPAIGAEVPASARPALRLLPVLHGAPEDAIAPIQAAMVPARVQEGDALVVEGERAIGCTCWSKGGWRCFARCRRRAA